MYNVFNYAFCSECVIWYCNVLYSRLIDTSSNSNFFATMDFTLELEYHQETKLRAQVNNSFIVVITTFKNIGEMGEYWQNKGKPNVIVV